MALFKILRGNSNSLPATKTDGWAYFCTDTGEFYIDYNDANGQTQRKLILADALDSKMDKANPEGTGSFSLNRKSGTALGNNSVAIGQNTTASGTVSFAEGINTEANGYATHAEGSGTVANGGYSHVEGIGSYSISGDNSIAGHAEGYDSATGGRASHAEGESTRAWGDWQHVQGKYNIIDRENEYAHIVGNGDSSNRSNAHTLDWDGNAWFAGDVYINGANKDSGKKLATEEYVLSNIPEDINIKETNNNLDQNFWRGTQEEYNALTNKDSNTMYIILDSEEGGSSSGGGSNNTNFHYGTKDLIDGVSTLTKGTIYFVI